MISGDHTILNSGSATGHDVFPFKTSISKLISLTSAPGAVLHTRHADGKLAIPVPLSAKFRGFEESLMKAAQLSAVQRWSILAGAAVLLSLAMGMRQSFGLFQPSIIRDTAITTADFSLASALQNVVWGVSQPMVGMLAGRFGARYVMLTGVLIYAAGLAIMMVSTSA